MRPFMIFTTFFLLVTDKSGVHATEAVPRATFTASLSQQTSALSDQLASSTSIVSDSSISKATVTSIDAAVITPGPDFKPGDEVELSLQQKWHLTTYWSCATFGKDRVFCGWHEPVLPGGDEIAAANGRLDTMAAALAAGALVLAAGAVL